MFADTRSRTAAVMSVLLGVLMVAAWSSTAATAGQGRPRPFAGTVTGTVSFPEVGTTDCPSTAVWLGGRRTDSVATGRARHLGRVSMTSSHCTPRMDGIEGGHMTLVAADGHAVHLTYSGLAPLPPAGVSTLHATLHVTVTGGSGRFDDATGEATLEADVAWQGFDDPEWPAVWTWYGWISY